MKYELHHGDCLDVVIPFDMMWNGLRIATIEKTAVLLFGSEPFSSELRISNKKGFRYDWIWEKDKGANFLQSSFQPLKTHENGIDKAVVMAETMHHAGELIAVNVVLKQAEVMG